MKNPLLTDAGITRHIAKGYGQGKGPTYRPWLEIRHVPSLGKSSRDEGWKTKRIQHFLSQHELRYYYMLEWSDTVLDIQEQYPLLPRSETEAICNQLGIKPPKEKNAECNMVLTTDFLITTTEGQFARSIKPADKLEDPRTLEKLEVERLFWKQKGMDWKIVTDREIDKVLAKNVEWLHPKRDIQNLSPLTFEDTKAVETHLGKLLVENPTQSFGKLCRETDQSLGYALGSSLAVFRHLLANKVWLVDMHTSIEPSKPIQIHEAASQQHRRVA